jgi:hypothetical protein
VRIINLCTVASSAELFNDVNLAIISDFNFLPQVYHSILIGLVSPKTSKRIFALNRNGVDHLVYVLVLNTFALVRDLSALRKMRSAFIL